MLDLIQSTGWIGVQAATKAISKLLTTFVLVNYLEPDKFGVYAFVLAITRVIGCTQALCSPSLLIRDLASNDNDSAPATRVHSSAIVKAVLGTTTWLLVAASLLLIQGTLPLDTSIGIVVASAAIIFSPSSIYQAYFLAKLDARTPTRIETTAALTTSFATILGVLLQAPLMWFFCLIPTAAIINCWLSCYEFHKRNKHSPFQIDWCYGLSQVKESIPLVVSSFAVSIYAKSDQLLLGLFTSDHELGQYAAAVTVAEAPDLALSLASTPLAAKLARIRKFEPNSYHQGVQYLYDFMLGAWFISAILISAFSPYIISALFGEKYQQASALLSIYIWAQFGGISGICRTIYMTNEKLLHLTVPITLAGAAVNLLLNLSLIPTYGACGAAWATLATYILTNIVLSFAFPELRSIAMHPFKSLNLIRSIKVLLAHRR